MLEYCLNCDYENEIKPDRSAVTVTMRGEDFEYLKPTQSQQPSPQSH
jgi:hypothetical protein